MGWNLKQHDIGFLRADGSTTAGLMLATDKNGVPIYQVDEDQYLVNQVYSSVPDYGALNPIQEIALIQDSWEGGIGLDIEDRTKPHRYWYSTCDLRKQHRALAGLASTSPTLPTSIIKNEGLESWTGANPDNWTPTGTVTKESGAGNIHSGTYSAKLAGASTIAQTMPTTYPGTSLIVKAWVKSDGGAYITLNDGVGSTNGAAHTGGGGWEQLSCTRAFNAAATTFIMTVTGIVGKIAYVDDCSCEIGGSAQAQGTTYKFIDFNDALYFISGSILYKIDSAGTLTYHAGYDGVVFKDLCVRTIAGTSYLFITTSNNAYIYMTSATVDTITVSTLANNLCTFLAEVGTTLWLAKLPNELRSNTSGLEAGAAWSGITYVGTADKNITALVVYDGALYVIKEDRPYYLTSAGAVEILTDMTTTTQDTVAGTNSIVWQGKLYMPYGASLLEYDIASGEFAWRSPQLNTNAVINYNDALSALCIDDNYLYATMKYSGADNYILAGREEVIEGVNQWVWHPIYEGNSLITYSSIVSKVYAKRLYIGGASGAVTYLTFDSYLTGTYFDTQWLHADFKGDNKAFIKLTLTMQDTTANVYWSASYKKWADSSWTSIGDFKTSPSTPKYIPVDASANKAVSRYIQFRFTATTNSTASTPVLKSFDCRAVLYPARRKLIKCVVRGADDIVDRLGRKLEANATLIDTIIQEVADATYPVTFYDPWGTTKTIKLLPQKPFYQIIKQEHGRNAERHYYLNLQEITVS